MAPSSPLLFLHIPKTAGMTLRGVLAARVARQATYTIGNDINADIDRLRELDRGRRERIELVIGHMSFGLHAFLAPGARYVTVLRDPVERVLSEYRFLKGNSRHPFHARVRDMTLSQYLDSNITGQAVNGQTRLLCGSHEPGRIGIAGREALSSAHLDQALANLERHFVLALTQERFEESLLLMARRLRWRRWPFFLVRNVSSASTRDAGTRRVDDDMREAIAERNALDMVLYRVVSQQLQRAITDAGPRFAITLERFVRANGIYQQLHWRRVRLARRAGTALRRLSRPRPGSP